MNKRQRWESSVIKKQSKETGKDYKKIKRLFSTAINELNNNR